MTQTTFEGIINALRDQKARQKKFCQAIKQAFIDAGECEDFRDPDAYEPPTNRMIDSILEALAHDFVSPKQSYTQALDNINYWFYDLDMMDYQFIEPVGGDSMEHQVVPAYIVHENGTKLPMQTPTDLYNTLVYCMNNNQQSNTDTRVDTGTELRSSLNVETGTPNPHHELHCIAMEQVKKDGAWMEMWQYLKETLDGELETDCKLEDTIESLGIDSLDIIMILFRMEAKYSVNITLENGQVNPNMTMKELNDLFYNNLPKEK